MARHDRPELKAAAPGQYRLACKLTDKEEHTIEGGYIFTVRGETASGTEFAITPLNLSPKGGVSARRKSG